MASIENFKISDWLKNQGIAIVVLIITNYGQYDYFTNEIRGVQGEIRQLNSQLLLCEKSKLDLLERAIFETEKKENLKIK